jgi:DNA-binding NarL/FixJ family response regulator
VSTRVAVVDDATVIRESFRALMPELEVVGTYSRVDDLVTASPSVDLVILDLHLVNASQPDTRQGVAAVRAVVGAGYRVCVFSQEERAFVLAACFAAGACGIVSKSSATATAQQSFVEVADGSLVVPQPVIGLAEVLMRRDSLTILGDRQRQVLAGRARGLTYAELSKQLFLSESTLRGYWREVTLAVSQHLQHTTPSDIERVLGLGPGDLLEYWPHEAPPSPGAAPPPPGQRHREWWRLGRRRRGAQAHL